MSGLEKSFAAYAEAQLARLLTQMDRDPDSPTFGCFDRNHWHYKMRDFASAVLQQGLFALEAVRAGHLAVQASRETTESWCVAAVNDLSARVGPTGGVDEYYPFERSYPAAAFSLRAAARVLLNWREQAPHLLEGVRWPGLRRLSAHVAGRVERQASNQQAAGLAGLALAEKIEAMAPPRGSVEHHAEKFFASQHPEGWFDEYGGPDFGYLTVTIDALADYFDATGDERAQAATDRAVSFLASLLGADGELPWTLNARNTDYVVPYGLVRAGARNPLAAWLVEALFGGLGEPGHFLSATDDRYHAHYIFTSLVRCLPHLAAMVAGEAPEAPETLWLEGAGFWLRRGREGDWTAFAGARKGGVLRIHRRGGPPVLDHGWRIREGRALWTTNWQTDAWRAEADADSLRVTGPTHAVGAHRPGPVRHMALRVLALLLHERLTPLLKKMLIFRPGSARGPRFERAIRAEGGGLRVADGIEARPGAVAQPSPRQNPRHVASAGGFSPEEWLPPLAGRGPRPLDSGLSEEHAWLPESGD